MKIGIITHYYKSLNCGGNLQAYALVKVIEKMYTSVEQISYDGKIAKDNAVTLKKIKMKLSAGILPIIKSACLYSGQKITNIFLQLIMQKPIGEIRELHQKAFAEFNHAIPHSKETYDFQTIKNCIKKYDVFITGSDQVWNLQWYYSPAYLLDFVPVDKIKFSYAASLGMSELDAGKQEIFRKSLKDYRAVSVREEEAVHLLENLSPVMPQLVLDPTMLLSKEEWDQVCTDRIIESNYIFCYFLGDDFNERKIAKKYAKKHGLKLVTMPHINNKIIKSDLNFGDIILYDVSPEKFISLIKYAEYIFTDSFHAAVFSSIYEKEYFVFQRAGRMGMSSRIYTLTKLFESESHFCDTSEKATMEYIEKLPKLDYSHPFLLFEKMKAESVAFLKKNLWEAEEQLDAKNN